METEVKKIPYLNLKAINEPYEKEIKDAINKVVNSGWYLQGEAVKKFEKSYAQFIGTEYCISCANGTDALKLILMGELAIGKLQKGDEVIVPANTYFATVLAISSVGLAPVLVDANIDTLQIDDQLIEARITPKTKAIMIVHLYGKLAWTPKIAEICKKTMRRDSDAPLLYLILLKNHQKEDIPEIFRMLLPTVFILARIWEHWEMREL